MKKFVNVKNISTEDYSNDLLKSLSNFCSKTPLNVSIHYAKDINKIYVYYEDDVITIDINPLVDKKIVIGKIKKQLEKYYPYLYKKEKIIPSYNDIEHLINNGLTLKEALSKTEETEIAKFKIIRKHDKFNELDVIDLEDNQMYKYKSKIPVAVIIERSKYKDTTLLDEIQLMYKLEKKEK